MSSELTCHAYFITACFDGNDGGTLQTASLYTGDPLDAPYTTDFTDMMEVWNGYKIIDANADGYTWMDRTIEAQTVLENGVIEDILGDPETYSFEVTPEADGVYYFGLHATTPARQGEFLMLSSLEIYDVENPPSGIEAVESGEGVKVFAGDGSVTVINPTGEQAMVYAMSGTLAAASADAYFAATLPAGAYVVKCGGTVVKVLVK